jgi:hypothetical protein
MGKVVVMTACSRPEYTKKVVDSFCSCYLSLEYTLIPFVEPVSEEVIKIFKNISSHKVHLHVNDKRLGHTLNTYMALSKGFETSDYVILIEDDTLLAKDFLKFHEFCRHKFENDESIFSVSAGHYSDIDKIYSENEISQYKRKDWFSNQGWATWKKYWNEPMGMSQVWETPETIKEKEYKINYSYGGWDTLVNKIHRKLRYEIVPTISRVKNIGAKGGVHKLPSENYHKQNIEVKDWAGNYSLENVSFN